MEEGNSLLSEDFLEKLTILRMDNTKFDLYKVEAKRALKEWRKLDVDWRKEYSEHKFYSEDEADIMDLMPLNIDPLYVKLEAVKLYGLIPIMARSSYGQLGGHPHRTPHAHCTHARRTHARTPHARTPHAHARRTPHARPCPIPPHPTYAAPNPNPNPNSSPW